MSNSESEVSKEIEKRLLVLLKGSIGVAIGKKTRMFLYPKYFFGGEGSERALVFSYVFPISANIKEKYNPAGFERVKEQGVNWFKACIGVKDIPCVPEFKEDSISFVHHLKLDQPFPRLRRWRGCRAVISELNSFPNLKVAYNVAINEFEAIRDKFDRGDRKEPRNIIIKKWTQRHCDKVILDKIAAIVLLDVKSTVKEGS